MALRFQRLTRDLVRKMQPGERIHEHGITAERQRNGDTRYSVGVMVDGQRVHRVVGRESEGVTREQAERYIEKVRTEAREGRLDLPRGRKRHQTVAEGSRYLLERADAEGYKDVTNKRRHLERYLVPFLGTERLDKLTNFRLRQYRRHRGDQGAVPATINRELATLSYLLTMASTGTKSHEGWRWIKRDARPRFPMEEEVRKPIQILTDEQEGALALAAAEDQDPDLWLFVLFASNATMRHTEIVKRRFEELDAPACRLAIDKAKAGARTQPITVALRDALVERRKMVDDSEGWIFPSRIAGAKVPYRRSFAKPFKRAVIRAKLDPKKVTPHILRHTGISRLLMKKIDIRTVQTISGHKTVKMLMHYAHVFDDHVDKAISELNRPISDAITRELHTASEEGVSGVGEVVPISAAQSAA